MNKEEIIILNYYKQRIKQRELANLSGFSLGKVNKIVNSLKAKGLIIGETINEQLIKNNKVKKAIILVAGFGLRMFPANNEKPKALLMVKGEILIERIIQQLLERDIDEIYIVVGFQKEKFEYLIDKYNVHLLVNSYYQRDNNLLSLYKALNYLGNSYIVPGDLYLEKNIFNKYEEDSWYSLSSKEELSGYYYVSRDKKLIKGKNKFFNAIGVAFISNKDKDVLSDNITSLCNRRIVSYWEDALFLEKNNIRINVNFYSDKDYYEINTFEDLKRLDDKSDSLNIECINIIKELFNVELSDIRNISISKRGMTNKSFTFEIRNKKYIMRVPGEGTEKLINRKQEYKVYQVISKYGISDNVVYMNPDNGIKITEYIDGSHNCDPYNFEEVKKCLETLKHFHDLRLKVDFVFDVFKEIDYYESLFGGKSLYSDYCEVKEIILRLKTFIDSHKQEYSLCHIDSVADNFIIKGDSIKIIDWEYSSMLDPHIDIAMFIIYAGYNKNEADKVIDLYFDNKCDEVTRYKMYSYIAICGFLWSNWCEYKYSLGIEFGEYSLSQYRYAKEYSRIVLKYLENHNA